MVTYCKVENQLKNLLGGGRILQTDSNQKLWFTRVQQKTHFLRFQVTLNSFTPKQLFWQANNIFRNWWGLFSLYFKEAEFGNEESEWKLLKYQLWSDIIFLIQVLIYCWKKGLLTLCAEKFTQSDSLFQTMFPQSLGVFRVLYKRVMQNSSLNKGLVFWSIWPEF